MRTKTMIEQLNALQTAAGEKCNAWAERPGQYRMASLWSHVGDKILAAMRLVEDCQAHELRLNVPVEPETTEPILVTITIEGGGITHVEHPDNIKVVVMDYDCPDDWCADEDDPEIKVDDDGDRYQEMVFAR